MNDSVEELMVKYRVLLVRSKYRRNESKPYCVYWRGLWSERTCRRIIYLRAYAERECIWIHSTHMRLSMSKSLPVTIAQTVKSCVYWLVDSWRPYLKQGSSTRYRAALSTFGGIGTLHYLYFIASLRSDSPNTWSLSVDVPHTARKRFFSLLYIV